MNPGVLLFCFIATALAGAAAAHGLSTTATVTMLIVAFESKDAFL